MQVGRRREDEVRHLVPPITQGVDHAHCRVDVARVGTSHANDLEIGSELTSLLSFEHEPERFSLALRDERKPDIHDVDADVGEHSRELVLVLWGDGHARHLLAVPQRVVVNANLVGRRELQVVRETTGVAGELFERLLQLYGLGLIHER